MAYGVKCDRCNMFIEGEEKDAPPDWTIVEWNFVDKKGIASKKIVICCECREDFYMFIKGGAPCR